MLPGKDESVVTYEMPESEFESKSESKSESLHAFAKLLEEGGAEPAS